MVQVHPCGLGTLYLSTIAVVAWYGLLEVSIFDGGHLLCHSGPYPAACQHFLHDMDDDDHYCLSKYLLLLLKQKIAYFLLQGQHQLCLAPIAGTSERLFGPGS
jgi:hypothetical protein